jgi:hypothetical protein
MKDGSGKKHSRCRARKLRAAKHDAWMDTRPPPKKKRAARPDSDRTLADVLSPTRKPFARD